MARFVIVYALLLILVTCVNSWKTCNETFCGQIRNSPEENPAYVLNASSVNINNIGALVADLITIPASNTLQLVVYVNSEEQYGAIAQVHIDHGDRLKAPDTTLIPFKVLERTDDKIILDAGVNKVIVFYNPFKIEFYKYYYLVSILNAQNRLVYKTGSTAAIGIDVSFPGTQRAYGIPSHAERLPLRTTTNGLDPYRLFNLDSGTYKINSTETLNGAIPILYAHGTDHSSGIWWINAGQIWVDITISSDQVDTFTMLETDSINLIVLLGPSLAAAVQPVIRIGGVPPLPPYFSLGYHQSRQSYMTQNTVKTVVEQFDKHDLPLDAVYLDIDYTDDNKFFTWNPITFPNPVKLQLQLAATNRKLVVQIAPHIKVESGYFVHEEATAGGYYVRNPNNSSYVGDSISGNQSSYIDFWNADAIDYYSSLFSIDTFKEKNVHVWINNNEPSVFDYEHENTMPGDLIHDKRTQHRDLHNLYGVLQAGSTYRGLLMRLKNVRPFVLSRSYSTGIQKFAAIWTGDNYASWEHLEISFPMCLTAALAGQSFCGANIGGFEGIPDDELYQRWYQAGAWLPLYRGHSSREVPRREPYLYPEDIQKRVRTALNQRYAHLPVWYTAFWEIPNNFEPIIRPITYHYPYEAAALDIDTQIMLGHSILAAPVLKKGVSEVDVYLPGGELEIWYNIDDNYKAFKGTGYHSIKVDLDSVPVFYLGGNIIPRKDIPRQSSFETHQDPYTLYVCLDIYGWAQGTIYVDDYESFNYKRSQYLYVGFYYGNGTLTSYKIDEHADYEGAALIDEIKILHPPKNVVGARVLGQTRNSDNQLKIHYSKDGTILTISNAHLSIRNKFKIQLETNEV